MQGHATSVPQREDLRTMQRHALGAALSTRCTSTLSNRFAEDLGCPRTANRQPGRVTACVHAA